MRSAGLPITCAVLCALAAGCDKSVYRGGGAGAAEPSAPPFYLVSVAPPDGALDVPSNAVVTACFSRAPAAGAVSGLTFRLIDEESGAEVPADIAPPGIAAGPCYRLAPKAPLALPRRRYRVEISPCIAAADGARLDVDRSTAPCTSRFTTGAIPDTYAPYFFFYQHRAEAVSASAIALSWFPAIDPAGGSPFHRLRYAVYQGPSADAIGYDRPVLLTLPGTLQCVVGGLEPATDYCFVIRPRDEAGNEDDNTVAVGARTFFAADTTRIALLYTADVFGNLEPCG